MYTNTRVLFLHSAEVFSARKRAKHLVKKIRVEMVTKVTEFLNFTKQFHKYTYSCEQHCDNST